MDEAHYERDKKGVVGKGEAKGQNVVCLEEIPVVRSAFVVVDIGNIALVQRVCIYELVEICPHRVGASRDVCHSELRLGTPEMEYL